MVKASPGRLRMSFCSVTSHNRSLFLSAFVRLRRFCGTKCAHPGLKHDNYRPSVRGGAGEGPIFPGDIAVSTRSLVPRPICANGPATSVCPSGKLSATIPQSGRRRTPACPSVRPMALGARLALRGLLVGVNAPAHCLRRRAAGTGVGGGRCFLPPADNETTYCRPPVFRGRPRDRFFGPRALGSLSRGVDLPAATNAILWATSVITTRTVPSAAIPPRSRPELFAG